MNDTKSSYEITLGGRRLTIRSGENEAHVQRVAELTERQINEIMLSGKRISYETAAAVAALRFAEEVLALQDDNMRLRRELDEYTAKKS